MKKRRPRNRPHKARDKRMQPPAAAPQPDPVAARLHLLEVKVAALVELAGPDNVRKANARLGSATALAMLERHVANGKLAHAQEVTAGSMVVELSEHAKSGEVLTESIVAELAAIEPAHAQALAGAKVGEMRDVGEYKAQVRRVWDVVPQPEASA